MKQGVSIRYLIKEGFRNVWVNRLMSIASIGVLMSCLILLGCGSLVVFNINDMLKSVEDQNVIMVYLEDGQMKSEINEIGDQIAEVANVESYTFVPKEDALKSQLDNLGDEYSEYFSSLENDNPLPDAYKIVLKDISRYDNTILELDKIDGIESVGGKSDLAYKLTSIRKMLYICGFWLVGILLFVALFIISNTIKLTMYSRRLEISIMKSVGATNGFIRVPFMVEGMVLGAIAAILSYVLVYYIYITAIKALKDLLFFFSGFIPFADVSLVLVLVFVLIGIGSGAMGSAVSINRYLKKEGSEINEV